MSDISASVTPVGHSFFTLAISPKSKKWDCSPSNTLEGQSGRRAYAGTEKASISSGCSTPPIQWAANHSPKQPQPELLTIPSSLVKAAAVPNDGLVVETSGSTVDHDIDSAVEVHRDYTTICPLLLVLHRNTGI